MLDGACNEEKRKVASPEGSSLCVKTVHTATRSINVFMKKYQTITQALLISLCVLMTASNVYLLHVNEKLRRLSQRSNEVAPGQVVPAVDGVGLDSAPIHLSPVRNHATLLMIYSPFCQFCEKNWPAWQSLIQRGQGGHTAFATIDLTGKADRAFLQKRGVDQAIAIHQFDPKEALALQLNATPQTILIGQEC